MLAAGDLRHRVVIEEQSSTLDAAGQEASSWSTFATVWAAIDGMSGVATIRTGADADLSVTRVSIRIRWLSGVHAGMRVTHGSDVYDIQAVSYSQQTKEFLDLVCFKGGSNG